MVIFFVLKSRKGTVSAWHSFALLPCAALPNGCDATTTCSQVDMLKQLFSFYQRKTSYYPVALQPPLSNLSGKHSKFLEIRSYICTKIIVLDDDSDIINNFTWRRNSTKIQKGCRLSCRFAFGCVEAKRMKGSFSDQQSCLSWTRIASRGFQISILSFNWLACGWYTEIEGLIDG
ncbi:hypothetical protein TNCV_2849731 [Trichonephila clavipes]|nr:hypothetical protein TNCV_2849731 [Trichonephila clavipes]